jgi:lipopolysaccharide/colanic/teichoic acid biosynthesis glycosyltransferase
MASVTQELQVGKKPQLSAERWTHVPSAKVAIESLVALCLLVITTPIILLVAFLVRITSRGPVFYTQKRVGRGGRSFTIYKIRTMMVDSEPDGPRWCRPGDPRVTPLGHFLRCTHLDELPQLVNILRGDMGLIGPRPERPEIVASLERVFPNYQLRLIVRPGLTGLAQVLQDPDTDLKTVERKLHFDLFYLNHRGFWLDVRILVATVLRVLAFPTTLIVLLFRIPEAPGKAGSETRLGVDRQSMVQNMGAW